MKYGIYAVCCGMVLSFFSCKKEKENYRYDNRPVQDVQGNSLLRLINLTGHSQVIAEGDTLTNYTIFRPGAPGVIPMYPSTKFFPDKGQLGQMWSIPRQILKNGRASLMTEAIMWQSSWRDTIALDVREDGTGAKDYLLLQSGNVTMGNLPRLMEIPRSVTAPSKAGYIKIRLVNMAQILRSQSDPVDQLSVPLTLAYADGTPVSIATTNVAVGKASDYIELPYGTYQFKVLTPDGIQVSASGGSTLENTDIIDPETSTLVKGAPGRPHTVSTHLTYAPVRTYQPGGIYTIMTGVSSFTFPYYNGVSGETYSGYQNAFRVLADVAEPANVNYARIQAVNALSGESTVAVKIDNDPAVQVPYGKQSDYSIRIRGAAHITAVDNKGAVIAEMDAQLQPNMNYTAWIYRRADGKAGITLVSNNLSGGWYTGGNGADGSMDRYEQKYPFHVRFLNFCKDLPYVTFTGKNGQPLNNESSTNLQPGIAPVSLPYVRFSQSFEAWNIMAYRSRPSVLPGSWITEIPVVKSTDFIARKELYVRGPLPVHEPGIFTVALIGQLNNAVPEGEKARMIIVKHTK
ncbi:DUF4397 domain-containing protein [Chitinophaga deserti]|uniref:DUF4397 domain-containing protein n=1 Tax=Chitinophaga deserti TaxID=2164099 RepID=UPI001300473D|nr:DUF4397 domain-containing protein [Chitinophaga deserti]